MLGGVFCGLKVPGNCIRSAASTAWASKPDRSEAEWVAHPTIGLNSIRYRLSVHQPECWAVAGQGDFASHFESMPLVERQVERIGISSRLQNEMIDGTMVLIEPSLPIAGPDGM